MLGITHGETVVLKRYAGSTRNAHGQKVASYAAPEAVHDVGVDAPVVSEPRDGTTQNVRFDYLLFFPPGTTVGSRDIVVVRGHECAVEQAGEPLANFFTGDVFHTEVTVRRVTP